MQNPLILFQLNLQKLVENVNRTDAGAIQEWQESVRNAQDLLSLLHDAEKWQENVTDAQDLLSLLHDAENIDNLSNPEQTVCSVDFNQSIEALQNSIASYDALEKSIQTQKPKIMLVHEHANKLLENNNFDIEPIIKRLKNVLNQLHEREQSYQMRRQKLNDTLQYKELSDWLTDKEEFLNNNDLGDNSAAVDALIKEHEKFEKSLQSNNVTQSGNEELAKRLDNVLEASAIRQRKLTDWFQLQQGLHTWNEDKKKCKLF